MNLVSTIVVQKYGTQPKHGYNYNFLYCGVKLFFADISINTVCNAKGWNCKINYRGWKNDVSGVELWQNNWRKCQIFDWWKGCFVNYILDIQEW